MAAVSQSNSALRLASEERFCCSSVDLVSSGGFFRGFQSFSCYEKNTWQSYAILKVCVFFNDICSCFVSPHFLARELQDVFFVRRFPIGAVSP